MKRILFAALALFALAAQAQSTSGIISAQNVASSGACTFRSCVTFDVRDKGVATVDVRETYTGALTLQCTGNGTDWATVGPTPFAPLAAIGTPTATIGSGAVGLWQVSAVAGSRTCQVTALGAVTGAAMVNIVTSPASIGSAAGGAGGGDASQANQSTQITAANLTNTALAILEISVDAVTTAVSATNTQLNPSTGTQTIANSTSVTPATSAVFPVSASSLPLPTGAATEARQTTPDTVLASSASALRSPVSEPDGAIITGTLVGANGDLSNMPIDMTGYECAIVQVTSAAGTITPGVSIDGSTYFGITGFVSTASGAASPPLTTATTGIWRYPRMGRFFKLTVSAQSGTNTAQVLQSKTPCQHIVGANVVNTLVANVSGSAAQGGTIPANPVSIGIQALTAPPTATVTTQSTRMIGTVEGKVIVLSNALPESTWQYAAASGGITNTTTAVTMAAALASNRNYVKTCQLSSDALGVATELVIRDGAAGTVIWRHKIGTAGILSYDIGFDPPLRGTANTLTEVATLTASVTGGVFINCQGYTAP